MLTLREALREDVPELLQMVRELAVYEREPDGVKATEEDFLRAGFGPEPAFRAIMAEWAGEPAGFALYCFGFSTWRGAATLYLEDLFVRPEHRKKRIGMALMQALAKKARELGCPRFVWQVLDWNSPAIEFYESLGAGVLREWLTVRLEGEALERLASRGTP